MAATNLLGGLANDDTVILLRRLVKIAESLGNVDQGGRQRVVLDALTAGLTLTAVGTVSAVTTVSTVTNLATIAGLDQRQFYDGARTTYNTGVRSNLIFS
jgi:hypothetical protein